MNKLEKMIKELKTQLNILGVSGSYKHPKCKSYECNHPLDPVEYDCEYLTKIDCDDCKYNRRGGRKDPEAKCNQQ
jgi:hypothetical protein